MKRYALKIAGTVAGAALLASVMAPAALAVNIDVTNNGPDSHNSVVVGESSNTSVNQSNNTDVNVNAVVVSSTGGNQANSNNGDVSIVTGDASSNLKVKVSGGTNEATVNPCGCTGNIDVTLDHNGPNSKNKVTVNDGTNQNVKQKNTTNVGVDAVVISKTGYNKANKNNGDSVSIGTGDSWSSLGVKVTGSSNTLNP